MNTSLAANDPQALVLRSEYASVPMRSPATSIILAEAFRRGQEARESRRISRAAAIIIRRLLEFASFANAGLDTKISTILTPGGPLVYRWQTK